MLKKITPLWDDYGTRYRLIQDNPGIYTWIFIPGGPGADSIYLTSLIKILTLPGQVWIIDLPGNGSNTTHPNYDYQEWFDLIIPTIQHFDNPIIVGHSFGGILAQMNPGLESLLEGIVLLNSTPTLWFDAAAKAKQQQAIPEPVERNDFIANPNQTTFDRLTAASLSYHFRPHALERGKAMFSDLPYIYPVARDTIAYLQQLPYQALWIPQQVKTLIIGGSLDAIHPPSLFEKPEYNRPNITKTTISEAGHWAWIDQPTKVKELFDQFCNNLSAAQL